MQKSTKNSGFEEKMGVFSARFGGFNNIYNTYIWIIFMCVAITYMQNCNEAKPYKK